MKTRTIQITMELLNLLDIKALETKTLRSLMSLNKRLKEKHLESIEIQQKILESYGVEVTDGNYVWKGHKKELEINKKIEEVLNEDLVEELTPLLYFMPEEEFISASKEKLNLAQMSYLQEILVVKD